ncbi:MAG TPA: flavodoxin domain-containing protein [Longilinea sp.]|nr:flavodoxin domain-containing protein [Longilinea sp.]
MTKNILIPYATYTGSTAEVAEEIGKVLTARGFNVKTQPAKTVKDLKGYDAVVLGSAVRIGKTNADAQAFMQRHAKALAGLPLAIFVVCLTMKDPTEENCATVDGYLTQLKAKAPGVQPVAEAKFAGVFEIERLSGIWKWTMSKGELEQGDFRNWDEIRAWAESLVVKLS